ncbi:MAG: hypothetical protein WBD95_20880 [Xanthobacteraceae bacterium]
MLFAMLTWVAAPGIVTASGHASAPEHKVAQRFGVVRAMRDRTKLVGDLYLPKNYALRPLQGRDGNWPLSTNSKSCYRLSGLIGKLSQRM